MNDLVERMDFLLENARDTGLRTVDIRIGVGLRDAFLGQAGTNYADGRYLGIPVSFDEEHPLTLTIENEDDD